MNVTSWKRKLDALYRLAKDQAGKPEGEAAKSKIVSILARFPELCQYKPGFIFGRPDGREFTLGDVRWMDAQGVDTSGRWTGTDFADAVRMMIGDYRARIKTFNNRRALAEMKFLDKATSDIGTGG